MYDLFTSTLTTEQAEAVGTALDNYVLLVVVLVLCSFVQLSLADDADTTVASEAAVYWALAACVLACPLLAVAILAT